MDYTAKRSTRKMEQEDSSSEKSLCGDKPHKIISSRQLKNSLSLREIISRYFSKFGGVPRKVSARISREVIKTLVEMLTKQAVNIRIEGLGALCSLVLDSCPVEMPSKPMSTCYPPGTTKISLELLNKAKKLGKFKVQRMVDKKRYELLPWYKHLYDEDGTPLEETIDEDWLCTDVVDASKATETDKARRNRSKIRIDADEEDV